MDWMKLKAILSCCAVELVHNNINNIFLWCWNYFLFHKVSTEKLWQYCRSSPGGSDPTISLVSVLEVTILSTISVWSSSNQQNVILIVLGIKYSQLFAELITVLAANEMDDVWEHNTKLFQTFWVRTFFVIWISQLHNMSQTIPSAKLNWTEIQSVCSLFTHLPVLIKCRAQLFFETGWKWTNLFRKSDRTIVLNPLEYPFTTLHTTKQPTP